MESDDDYESFSFHNHEPSPSPKLRRLKRLKKSTVVSVQSTAAESVTELIDLPRVDFARLETLESSGIRAFDDSSERPSDDLIVDGDPKETNRSLQFDDVSDDVGKVKEIRACYDDTRVNSDVKETNEDGLDDDVADVNNDVKETNGDGLDDDVADVKETNEDIELDDDVAEEDLNCGVVRTDRKATKRALDFDDDDDVNDGGVDELAGKEGGNGNMDVDIREDDEGVKKGKKKKLKSSGDEPKGKSSYSSKRREEKERRAHLDQLHVESQRILRETRGVSFKSVPLVQKPISSILERIRQRKLEMSKKFPQSNTNDSYKEDDEHVKDCSNSVETEATDLSVKEEKVTNVLNGDLQSDDVGMDIHDVCKEQKNVNACSQKDLDVESTPALRPPVDDTQELFGDTQTSDGKESEDDDDSCELVSSSQEEEEEEMGPSLLTMKLKFDSAPDDICEEEEEEENDKENIDPHDENHSSPIGDPVKAFVDDEAEEEDDSDNDRMVFGDGEENENEDEEDDIEELKNMIATGYKERPIDLETRNELHQKWLEEKDAAGTDDLMRRLKLASELKEGSLSDVEDVEMNVNDDDDDDGDDSDHSSKKVKESSRFTAKKAKEMIAQMFNDKDDDYFSSDEEETEKILARGHLLNNDKVKGKFVSPMEDEDSREVFDLIRKQSTVPEGRKKANSTSIFDTMLTGGNSNSSSKSSFLSRMSSRFVPVPSKQGGSSGARSFIFGRDDSNSRNSIFMSEDTSDTIRSREVETKKVTTKYKGSQFQGRSSSQTTKLVSESSSSSSSFFEILKQSSVQSKVHDHKVELSQSVFAAFKIPKKPVKIQGRV